MDVRILNKIVLPLIFIRLIPKPFYPQLSWGDEEFALINYFVVHAALTDCELSAHPHPHPHPHPACKFLKGQEPHFLRVVYIFWGAWQHSVPCGVLSTFCLMLLTRPKDNPLKNLPLKCSKTDTLFSFLIDRKTWISKWLFMSHLLSLTKVWFRWTTNASHQY